MHDPITDLIGRIIVEIANWFFRLPRFVINIIASVIGLIIGGLFVLWIKPELVDESIVDDTVKTFIECDGDVCDRYAFECSGGLMYKTTISNQPVIKPVYDDDREQKTCDTEGVIE